MGGDSNGISKIEKFKKRPAFFLVFFNKSDDAVNRGHKPHGDSLKILSMLLPSNIPLKISLKISLEKISLKFPLKISLNIFVKLPLKILF